MASTQGNGTKSAVNFQGRVPPQNIEAEQGVLGSIMLQSSVIDDIAEFLRVEHFYDVRHQHVYAAILSLYQQRDEVALSIDAVTVREQLTKSGKLDAAGGVPYLLELMESVPNAAGAVHWGRIVREKWLQRSLSEACTEILTECYDNADDIEHILNRAERRIFDILEEQESATRIVLNDILFDAMKRIHERVERRGKGEATGIRTGFVDLDRQLSGLQPTELIILAARPSMGKTALVCNIAEAVAEQGHPVLIFSLEQSKLELAERLLCIRSGVNGHRLRNGEIDDDERNRLLEASGALSEMPIFVDDAPGRSMSQIAAIGRRVKRRQQALGLIVVDYLQLIEPEDRKAPREQQIAAISRRLKFLAKSLNVPVIALAQLNRGVELREDKRPRLADLRESGAIEQDADVVAFLHRPAAYDPTDRPNEADVIVAKNRNGPVGTVTLAWLSEAMRFANHTPAEAPEGGWVSSN